MGAVTVCDLAESAIGAARKICGRFEKVLCETIEKTALDGRRHCAGLGWLFGRLHRPL